MPPSLSFLTNRWATAAAASRGDALRVALVAVPHVGALAIMAFTEYALEQRLAFLLAWGLLNGFWLAVVRRPVVSGAISLTIVVGLVLLSELKYKVLWMTVNFVDLMVIDRDTIDFLLTIFPVLRSISRTSISAVIPTLVLLLR